jgi:hypothetical protein
MVLLFHSVPGHKAVLTTPTLPFVEGSYSPLLHLIGVRDEPSIHKTEGRL